MMKRSGAILITAVTVLLGASTLNAAKIVGTIGFSGGWTPLDSGNTQQGAISASTTGIDFDTATVFTSPAPTGDFSGLGGSAVTLTDFQFDPLSPPVDPLWAAGTFEFVLESIVIDFRAPAGLVLSGTGFVRDTTDITRDAAGTWSFSGNPAGGQFNFSSSSNVPEPATFSMFMLGAGLLGAARARRRRRMSKE